MIGWILIFLGIELFILFIVILMFDFDIRHFDKKDVFNILKKIVKINIIGGFIFFCFFLIYFGVYLILRR